MTRVVAELSMSIDGFIADPEDGVPHIFDWYDSGPIEIPTAKEDLTFHVTEASAKHIREGTKDLGAIVTGRRLFDVTDGWGGQHPADVPVVVLTHNVPTDWAWLDTAPFTFVTEGIEKAVESATTIAGDKTVAVAGGITACECLNAGLLDEVVINLAPVLLGAGIPFFSNLRDVTVLENPRVIEGDRVTHLYYRVRR